MTVRRNVTPWASTALVLTALLTTSCGGAGSNTASRGASSPSAVPHGHVEGAREAAEQQSRLLLNDPVGGDTRILDLVTAVMIGLLAVLVVFGRRAQRAAYAQIEVSPAPAIRSLIWTLPLAAAPRCAATPP